MWMCQNRMGPPGFQTKEPVREEALAGLVSGYLSSDCCSGVGEKKGIILIGSVSYPNRTSLLMLDGEHTGSAHIIGSGIAPVSRQ